MSELQALSDCDSRPGLWVLDRVKRLQAALVGKWNALLIFVEIRYCGQTSGYRQDDQVEPSDYFAVSFGASLEWRR